MTRHLKLMPDYECYAIWDIDENDNIAASTLPISDELTAKISSWEDRYDLTLNQEDPVSSGFVSDQERKAFDDDGRKIWQQLKSELGEEFQVSYFSVIGYKLFES